MPFDVEPPYPNANAVVQCTDKFSGVTMTRDGKSIDCAVNSLSMEGENFVRMTKSDLEALLTHTVPVAIWSLHRRDD